MKSNIFVGSVRVLVDRMINVTWGSNLYHLQFQLGVQADIARVVLVQGTRATGEVDVQLITGQRLSSGKSQSGFRLAQIHFWTINQIWRKIFHQGPARSLYMGVH